MHKHEVLMYLGADSPPGVARFDNQPEEGDNLEVYYMPEVIFDEMGSPDRITLSVMPYDALNAEVVQGETVMKELGQS